MIGEGQWDLGGAAPNLIEMPRFGEVGETLNHKPSSSIIFAWSKPTTDWPSMIVTGVL
jgi:hypothetical protein